MSDTEANKMGDVVENHVEDNSNEVEAEGRNADNVNSDDADMKLRAIETDHKFITENVTPAAILTLTQEYITVVIMRTPYSRVQLRIQFTAQYPDVPPIVELTSPTLPGPLLKNKEKECVDLMKPLKGQGQVHVAYNHMLSFIQTNLFVPCWKEVKQISTLCEGKGKLGASELEGVLQLRLTSNGYNIAITIRVPPSYPEEAVVVEFGQSNFPQDIQHIYKSQAEEIGRRCVSGYNPDQALQGSRSLDTTRNVKASNNTPAVRLTNSGIKNLKHDVNVLKQMSDLRTVNASKDKRNTSSAQNTADRRDARKDLRKLAKSEAENDEQQVRELKEMEQREMEALMGSKASDVAQPSLLPVVRFLVEDFVSRLPQEKCQACQKCLLPSDPSVDPSAGGMKPMRTFCGHWLHYKCLDEWLTSPPFVRQCPVCTRRIWHPDWSADVKQLEQAWQNKEARQREMSDVSDFLGLG